MRKVVGIIAGLGVLLTATSALAQPTETPPSGTEPNAQTPPPPPKPVAAATVTPSAEPKKDDGITDHEKVVGKFGVMYFGVTEQPIGESNPGNVLELRKGTVSTPVIGMRYWFQERMGIDVGLGFGLSSTDNSTVTAGGQAERNIDGPARLGFMLHGGLPLAFAYGKHYKFLLVPEVNFGYATQTEAAQNVAPGAATPPDIHRSGLRIDAGARVGSEIQFGFIGIPELALQASVGLNFRHQVWSASRDANAAAGVPNPESNSISDTTFGTTVQSDPWALFVNNVSAIYYFP